jgi:Ca2+-binding EF-hand superfamily protein
MLEKDTILNLWNNLINYLNQLSKPINIGVSAALILCSDKIESREMEEKLERAIRLALEIDERGTITINEGIKRLIHVLPLYLGNNSPGQIRTNNYCEYFQCFKYM